MGFLVKNANVLGDKLGAILFQLPPNLRCNLKRLKKFAELIPGGTRAVMEFRNDSWYDETVFEVLGLRKPGDGEAQLENLADHLANSTCQQSFVFFKHETEGAAPEMAAQFALGRRRNVKVA